MYHLLNKSKKDLTLTLTEHPITRPEESPAPPIGKKGEQLSRADIEAQYGGTAEERVFLEKLEAHPAYSPAEEITLKVSLNDKGEVIDFTKFENDEQAEYFFKFAGSSYEEQYENGPQVESWIVECDHKGNELEKDKSKLHKKYRATKGRAGVNRAMNTPAPLAQPAPEAK